MVALSSKRLRMPPGFPCSVLSYSVRAFYCLLLPAGIFDGLTPARGHGVCGTGASPAGSGVIDIASSTDANFGLQASPQASLESASRADLFGQPDWFRQRYHRQEHKLSPETRT